MEHRQTSNILPAQRIGRVEEYYFSRKLKEVAQRKTNGHDVISLAIGSPDLPPSPQTVERLCEVAHDATSHGYQPTKGTPELLSAIAKFYHRWYGVGVDAATEVLPLIGSKEGILHTTLAFVNPGEKVLVPNPGYPTYTSLSRLLGAEVVHYDLDEQHQWQPDFETLEAMDLHDVRLMWVNYPHMPTGAAAQRATYERLVEFALRHNIVVVNDNPYSFILNDHPLSLLQVDGAKECCIEFNSMSKTFNMPGWRVGMCVSNPTFISWMLRVKSNIDSGTFRGIQLAAATAMDNADAWHATFNREVYARRRKVAERIMTALNCTFDSRQVGMFLWGKIADHWESSEALTEWALQTLDLFITPGFIFGSNGERYIRISLCADENTMERALQRIVAAQINRSATLSQQQCHTPQATPVMAQP